ncbi:MAG: tryptophan--tRNA ligase [Candidatus Paceibacterota bacterium]
MTEKRTKPILISGMKPTGRIHLGNYLGAIKQVIDLKDKYDTTFFIADLHALTSVHNSKDLRQNTRQLALDCLGAGIDTETMGFYKQSDLPEVTELCWIFNCLLNVSYLMRAHAYKDAVAKGEEANAGLFSYPVLMAADILIHKSKVVPVGEDQRQHLEYARDLADKFNKTYKKVFPLPKGIIPESVGIIPGTDGRKMSKSYNNTISLFAEREEIKKEVMKIPTDSKSIEEAKDPDTCNVFRIYSLVAPKKDTQVLRKRYTEGGVGYKEAKDILIDALDEYLRPFRERRKKYEKDPEKLEKALGKGSKKARANTLKTMEEVRRAVGILPVK